MQPLVQCLNMQFHARAGIVWNSKPLAITVLPHNAVDVKPGGDIWFDSMHEFVDGSLCLSAGP
jgi:hypothetical protein